MHPDLNTLNLSIGLLNPLELVLNLLLLLQHHLQDVCEPGLRVDATSAVDVLTAAVTAVVTVAVKYKEHTLILKY